MRVNLLLRDFVDGDRTAARRLDARARSRRRRALFVSSPIGLGHARRDVAIARELRGLVPGLEIDWLAQDPVTRVLEAEGERIHPASAHLANESRHIESESAEHDLHVFQAWRRMDEILLANFMVFHDVVREAPYDLWIGDEAWEVDYYLHENPELKRAAVRVAHRLRRLAARCPTAASARRCLTADYNAEMIEHDRAVPARARPGALRRRARRHRRPSASARACPRSASGRRSTTPSPATSPASTRRLPDRDALRARAGLRAGRAGVHRHGRRLRRRRAPAAARRSRPSTRRSGACRGCA